MAYYSMMKVNTVISYNALYCAIVYYNITRHKGVTAFLPYIKNDHDNDDRHSNTNRNSNTTDI